MKSSRKARPGLRTLDAWVAALGLLAASSCSNPQEPASFVPTVLVTNPFCDAGSCVEVSIWAHPWAWPLPQPKRGLKRVGVFNGPSACLPLGPLWEITVRGVDSVGAVTDSTTYAWTPDDTRGVYLAAQTVNTNVFAMTRTFVPAEAHGWDLSFSPSSAPGAPPVVANLVASEACTPTAGID